MAKLPTRPFKVGPAELRWIFINGDGSLNQLKEPPAYEYKATAVMSEEAAKPFQDQILEFWNEYTTKKQPKSVGYKKNEEGKVEFTFKTNTSFKQKDGSDRPVKIRVFRANGSEITDDYHSRELKAANGSEGIVHGTMAIYDRPSGGGVTLYLSAIQFTKFIEYSGGVDVAPIDEEVDDGLGSDDGVNVAPVQTVPEI